MRRLDPVQAPQLLPHPRHLRLAGGVCRLPGRLFLEPNRPLSSAPLPRLIRRLNEATDTVRVAVKTARSQRRREGLISFHKRRGLPTSPTRPSDEAYELSIDPEGIRIGYLADAGLHAAVATLCQLLRQYGRRLPCLVIRDWPDFPRRGVLLDVSRGRVPSLKTLMQLATDLAGFKVNELQLYLEHTFAYRAHPEVWRGWGALTAKEIRRLDAHCRALGIDLVPNQNSFGHLRHWLKHKRLAHLAEVQTPYPAPDNTFLRYPSTLAPTHPGTLRFLRGLYDELLPNFSSGFFNVGGDETWDLGRGRSRAHCQQKGQGQVYLEFLSKIHREVRRRGRRMMFWGDIILKYPHLIGDLPKDSIALCWGYEANHPFQRNCRAFARAKIPFYVCPGTSTWQTLIGRNDNAMANLKAAACAGKRHRAMGYLITDWGDGGHPQPLAVSYPTFVAGASIAWCGRTYDEGRLAPVLDREVFRDPTGHAAESALRMGIAHRKFGYAEPNATPFGATLAAPPPEQRELFCRNGLKYYARLLPHNIRAAWSAVAGARVHLRKSKPTIAAARLLVQELDLAAWMAEESCRYLLWQQALAGGRLWNARSSARIGARNLQRIKREFSAYWPARNKGTPSKSAVFFDWRIQDYRQGRLHYTPREARL